MDEIRSADSTLRSAIDGNPPLYGTKLAGSWCSKTVHDRQETRDLKRGAVYLC